IPLFSTDPTPTDIYTLSLHDALPIYIFIIEKSDNKPTNKATPEITYCSSWKPAKIIGNLLKKPLNGGIPASDIALIKNIQVNAGCVLSSPPIFFKSVKKVVPVTCSAAPANKKR